MDAGERKKRKVELEGDKKQEKNEDQEVEEFFALIRRNREIRERMNMINAANIEQQNKAANENVRAVVAAVEVEAIPWNPTFRSEDFMEEGPSTSNPTDVCILRKEEVKEDKKKDDDDDGGGGHLGLDLNLSL